MVLQITLAEILLIACIFPRPCGTTQLLNIRAYYPKPSNKMYLFARKGHLQR